MTDTPTEKASTTSAERLVFFTDAVAAIAITLLILPLMESVSSEAGQKSIGDFVHDHIGEFGAFVLSFAVIFRLWWAHHQLFRHITRLDSMVVRLSLLWTFAVVLLPIPTALITATKPSAGSVALYGGALCLASGSLMLLGWYGRRHPELTADATPVPRAQVLSSATAFGIELVATAIGAVFAASINFWAFLLMPLGGPIQNLIKSRWRGND
ncbi:TMEM175 family protein [Actinoplanes sp. KI2]|uniref:TMEM175 family protein n=1 Tax=Actinoplanes sp. KI2 TaxID=2983315 RepID=UPI0021D58EB1|nr:TMEM175 family protein [Actinoplanes sp. KI2]MCU7726430.1 TMEM175 family protein [Actinoplanes sp. KI2]